MWPYASLTCIGSSISLTPLVLKVHFWDYTGSLDNPNMDIRSRFTNYHSYFRIRSTFQISSPISHISITWPSHQWINDSDLANREWDMYHLWIDNGCKISIVNGHSSSAGNLIPSRRTNDYPLMLQWVIPWEMRCRQHQSIMTSWDMQSHIRDKSITNNGYIGAQSTKWTYTNQPLVRSHFLGLGKWDVGFICPHGVELNNVGWITRLFPSGTKGTQCVPGDDWP